LFVIHPACQLHVAVRPRSLERCVDAAQREPVRDELTRRLRAMRGHRDLYVTREGLL
jgi:hypothetical protein